MQAMTDNMALARYYNNVAVGDLLEGELEAAREQLRILGEQAEVGVLPEADRESPAQIAKRALQAAKLQGFDVLILDTAGRVTIDEGLMAELREVKALTIKKIGEIDARLAELQSLKDELSSLAASCDGDHRPDCPILNALSGG